MWHLPTNYFAYQKLKVNKLNETEVDEFSRKENKPVRYMTGKRFGGFIFDTNALHGAFLDDSRNQSKREVYILEFASMRHVNAAENEETRVINHNGSLPGTSSENDPDKIYESHPANIGKITPESCNPIHNNP